MIWRGLKLIIVSLGLATQSVGSDPLWMVPAPLDAVLIDNRSHEKDIQIVRLSPDFLIYTQEQNGRRSNNIRLEAERSKYSKIRSNQSTWVLETEGRRKRFSGPVLQVDVDLSRPVERSKTWTDKEILKLSLYTGLLASLDEISEFRRDLERLTASEEYAVALFKKQNQARQLGGAGKSIAICLQDFQACIDDLQQELTSISKEYQTQLNELRSDSVLSEEIMALLGPSSSDALSFAKHFLVSEYSEKEFNLQGFMSDLIIPRISSLLQSGVLFRLVEKRHSVESLQTIFSEFLESRANAFEATEQRLSVLAKRVVNIDILETLTSERMRGANTLVSRNDLKKFLRERELRLTSWIGRAAPSSQIASLLPNRWALNTKDGLKQLAMKVRRLANEWPDSTAFDVEVAHTLDIAGSIFLQAAFIGKPSCLRDLYSEEAELAQLCFEESLMLASNSEDATRLYMLALASFAAGDHATASRIVESFSEVVEKIPDFLFLRSRIRCSQGRMEEGLMDLTHAVETGFRNVKTARSAAEFRGFDSDKAKQLKELLQLRAEVKTVGGRAIGNYVAGSAYSGFTIKNTSNFDLVNASIRINYTGRAANSRTGKKMNVTVGAPILRPGAQILVQLPREIVAVPMRTYLAELQLTTQQQGATRYRFNLGGAPIEK